MTEHLRFFGEPRELEIGDTFKPFDGPIAPLDIQRDLQSVSTFEFRLRGIEGRISLVQENGSLSDGYKYNYREGGLVTPLGPIRKVIEIGEDGLARLEECPLSLDTDLMLHSADEVSTVQEHALELKTAEQIFYLLPIFDSCRDVEDVTPALERVSKHGFEEAVTNQAVDEAGKKVFIWLPHEPDKVRGIEAKFVQRPQFNTPAPQTQ